jgi:phosphomevalonate kinase
MTPPTPPGLPVLAPGKAFLCGEYAVLEGAPATVMAVDRYARAFLGCAPAASAFVAAAVREAHRLLAGRGVAPPPGVPQVDTRALARADGTKLGLGSSAACTVAAVGAVLAAAGLDPGDPRLAESIRAAAAAAHAAAQGSGSGADVAAAVLGGIHVFWRTTRGLEHGPKALPPDLAVEFVWTGRAASTAAFLATLGELRAARPSAHAARLADLASAARVFAAATTAPEMIGAAAAAARAMARLGEDAGLPIVTAAHRRLADLAAAHGGTAKPSGAGGGDLAVAFLPAARREDFLRAALAAAAEPVCLRPGRGVHLAAPAVPAP